MNRGSRSLLAVCALGAVAACSNSHDSAKDAIAAIPVSGAVARQARFVSTLDLSGSVSATRSVTVGANSAGRIVNFYVRVGDRVSTGDIIAQIDTSGYRAALAQAQGGTSAAAGNQSLAWAQLTAAQSRLRLAQVTARRMSILFAEGAISKQQRDETQASLSSSSAEVAQAQAQIAAASGQAAVAAGTVSAAEVPLAETTIRAPFSGTVTTRFVEAGAVVAPGSPVVSLDDDRNLEVDMSVPENATAWLWVGQRVPVRIDAINRSMSGRLRAIVSSQGSSLHSVILKITIPPQAGLLPGMFARVSLPTEVHHGPAVPVAALVTRGGQSGVFILEGGHAHFMPVDTGALNANLVEVRNTRVVGAVVATSNLERLSDGALVSLAKP